MPDNSITDYEKDVIPAIRKIFFVSQHSSCWFHYSQCILRKIQEFGLNTFFMNDQKIQKIKYSIL